MASWDYPTVAAPPTAAYGAPVQDFSSLGNTLQDFVKGRQAGREEDKARAFRNGIPRVGGGETGDYDVDKIANTAAKVGGLDYAKPFIDMQINAQNARGGQKAVSEADAIASGGSPAPAASPYGTSAPSPRVVTPAPGAGPTQPPAAPELSSVGSSNGGQDTIRSLATELSGGQDAMPAIGSAARVLRIHPDVPLTPDQVAKVKDFIGNAARPPVVAADAPQPAAVAQSQPAPAPQPVPNQRVAQGFDAAAPQTAQLQADRYGAAESRVTQQAIQAAAIGNTKLAEELKAKAGYYHDLQKGMLDQVAKANEPTTNRKDYEYAVAKGFKGSPDEWAAQAEGDKATAGERAKADVKEQQTYIDAGKQAGNRLTTLNTIGNIVNSDKNLTLGFGADTALKVKMALQQLGVPVGDLSGAEGIQKMNAALASEMAKSLSGRPTQFEFKSFMANNPGLLLDKSGNQRLIGIYSQLAQREYQLGKLARQNGDNWSNWDNVVEKFDAQHPIVDPISKQPISTNSVIAPGPAKGTTASAPAAPAQEGAMAINPKTGELLKLQGGKWVPFA